MYLCITRVRIFGNVDFKEGKIVDICMVCLKLLFLEFQFGILYGVLTYKMMSIKKTGHSLVACKFFSSLNPTRTIRPTCLFDFVTILLNAVN